MGSDTGWNAQRPTVGQDISMFGKRELTQVDPLNSQANTMTNNVNLL